MKPDLLRRLEAVERAIEQTARPPLRLPDVLTFDPVDREVYWSGPDGEIAVLTRIGVPVGESTGYLHTIVIDLHESSRDRWQATAGMDDDDLETFEQAAIFQEQRREAAERDARERAALEAVKAAEPRYDYAGYPLQD